MTDWDLLDLLAGLFVSAAITGGKLCEDNRKWAEERFKVDPMAFKRYVQRLLVLPPRPNPEPIIAHLERVVERLRAENAAQEGAIKAANEKIIELQKVLGKERGQRHSCEEPQPQLPRWQSHEIVTADKIVAMCPQKPLNDGSLIIWELACGEHIQVSRNLINRVPLGASPIGGYFVEYDNFASWLPAAVFEKDYTRMK